MSNPPYLPQYSAISQAASQGGHAQNTQEQQMAQSPHQQSAFLQPNSATKLSVPSSGLASPAHTSPFSSLLAPPPPSYNVSSSNLLELPGSQQQQQQQSPLNAVAQHYPAPQTPFFYVQGHNPAVSLATTAGQHQQQQLLLSGPPVMPATAMPAGATYFLYPDAQGCQQLSLNVAAPSPLVVSAPSTTGTASTMGAGYYVWHPAHQQQQQPTQQSSLLGTSNVNNSSNPQMLAYMPMLPVNFAQQPVPVPLQSYPLPAILYGDQGSGQRNALPDQPQQQQQQQQCSYRKLDEHSLTTSLSAHSLSLNATQKGSATRQKNNTGSADSVTNLAEASAKSHSLSSAQGLPYDEDPVEIDTTKHQLIVNYLPQRLTDERFKQLFRPYGELIEEASHIIYDFRHHKMVAVPSSVSTEQLSSTTAPSRAAAAAGVGSALASATRGGGDDFCTPLSGDRMSTTPQASLAAEKTCSSMDLTSPATAQGEEGTSMDASLHNTAMTTATTTTITTATALARSMPRSKGYGFIYYKDGASTERAIKELNGMEVDGKRIKVRYAKQQRCVEDHLDGDSGTAGAVLDAVAQLRRVAVEDDSSEDEESALVGFDIDVFKADDE